MSSYRRIYHPGACYFFTVVTHQRQPLFQSPENVQLLREAFRYTLKKRPFVLVGVVVLPDHLHCIWNLPSRDADFSNRWKMLKGRLSRQYALLHKVEKPVLWQPRFWEHMIRDKDDFRNHMDYLHFNPVKHGLVKSPGEWPYSSIHKLMREGDYPADWGSDMPAYISKMSLE